MQQNTCCGMARLCCGKLASMLRLCCVCVAVNATYSQHVVAMHLSCQSGHYGKKKVYAQANFFCAGVASPFTFSRMIFIEVSNL